MGASPPKSKTRRIGVDLARLAGPHVNARWYDPTAGGFVSAEDEPLTNNGVQKFKPPGRNAGRDSDWVLLLESAP